jgi:uncharacterized protein (TIGR03067 family)
VRLCGVLILALGSVAPSAARDPLVEGEVKKLQGTWVRLYVVADGKKTVDGKKAPGKEITLTIKGGSYGGEKFTVDPAKSPKHIDVTTADGKGGAATLPGIYELKDGVLKLCFPFPFEGKTDGLGKRPAGFTIKAGSNDVLEVYELKKK